MLWMTRRDFTRKIVVHHTAGEGEDKSYFAALLAEARRRFESYSYVVLYDEKTDRATIKQMPWPDNVITNHARGANRTTLGIAVEGNYMKQEVPEAVKNELVYLLTMLCKRFGLKPGDVIGHRDVTPTLCPGDKLYAALPEIRRRLKV